MTGRRTRHQHWLRYRRLTSWPPVGRVRFGSLRRTRPVSGLAGWERGTPVDRALIDRFLAPRAEHITGRVLEVGERRYAGRFGTPASVDVLDVDAENPDATVRADLMDVNALPQGVYDCVICTQTLMYTYDLRAAVRGLHRLAAPGGMVLVTVAGMAPVSRAEDQRWGDHWRFTPTSAQRLFDEAFDEAEVVSFGNVLTATAFLHGLSAEELTTAELLADDPLYPVVIGVTAIK